MQQVLYRDDSLGKNSIFHVGYIITIGLRDETTLFLLLFLQPYDAISKKRRKRYNIEQIQICWKLPTCFQDFGGVFKKQKKNISPSYSRYCAEAYNEWRGSSPRLSVSVTHLQRNVAEEASRCDTVFERPRNRTLDLRIDSDALNSWANRSVGILHLY